MTTLELHRDQVERKADLLRERLLRTIDLLDQRRHIARDVRGRARRHPAVVMFGGAALALAAYGAVALAVRAARARDQDRLRRERVEAVRRLWQHPERVARREHGLLFRVARAALVAAATAAAVILARRGARRAWRLVSAPAAPPQLRAAPEQRTAPEQRAQLQRTSA